MLYVIECALFGGVKQLADTWPLVSNEFDYADIQNPILFLYFSVYSSKEIKPFITYN